MKWLMVLCLALTACSTVPKVGYGTTSDGQHKPTQEQEEPIIIEAAKESTGNAVWCAVFRVC